MIRWIRAHLTQKSQEALHDAQTKALRLGHSEVDGEHLLLALLDQPDGLVPRLLATAGADPDRLRPELEAELGRRPRVTGPGVAPGQVSVTQRLARLLDTRRAGGPAAQGRVRLGRAPACWRCSPRARTPRRAGCCAARA